MINWSTYCGQFW